MYAAYGDRRADAQRRGDSGRAQASPRTRPLVSASDRIQSADALVPTACARTSPPGPATRPAPPVADVPHLTAPDRVGSAGRRVARRVDAPRLPQGTMTPGAFLAHAVGIGSAGDTRRIMLDRH